MDLKPKCPEAVKSHVNKHRYKYYGGVLVAFYKLHHITGLGFFHEGFTVLAVVIFEHVFPNKAE